MNKRKNIYFASDFHLNAPSVKNKSEHEKKIVRWLDSIKDDAKELYLVGDIFDFWFEYKRAIPKGNTRFLGKLCEFTDLGIPIYFFTGNHDIWVFDYLPNETGVKVFHKPLEKSIDGKQFFIAHGDGLTKYETKFNLLKKVFTNRFAQWLFRWMHPDVGIKFAHGWSKKSREDNMDSPKSKFRGEEEWLFKWAKEKVKEKHFDYFIFGHRHAATIMDIDKNSKLLFLGDWLKLFSYAVWDGEELMIKYFKE